MMIMVDKVATRMSNPEEQQNNVYEASVEFVDEFRYEYNVVAKEPPKNLDAEQKTAWISQDKLKVFLGKFSSCNLQKPFE